ncbi:MAG: ferredoxin III [Nitrospirae bacterium]|nr:MAG: ferredoxin III [Nitrospirota bacterium]
MATITGRTRGGMEWIPRFLDSIDMHKCIGCGRCYKACSRTVLELIEKPFEGEDEYGDDLGNKVMSVAHPEDCIGCGACIKTCAKKCQVQVEV